MPVYNNYEFTRRCLETVRRLAYPNLETIVVDNASTDETGSLLPAEFPWVRAVRTSKNLGFAGGCNVGIRHSRGEYVLLLNNDTEIVDADLLNVFVREMEAEPRLAGVGPRIVDYEDHDAVFFDGAEDAYGHLDIAGAATMLRRRALEEVGLLDESFFAYFEDRDLFARLKEAGWSLRHIPRVRVAHRVAATSRPGSTFYEYYHSRNLVVFARRHVTLRGLLVRLLPAWLRREAWFLKASVEHRNWPAIGASMKGYVDGLRVALSDRVGRPPSPRQRPR